MRIHCLPLAVLLLPVTACTLSAQSSTEKLTNQMDQVFSGIAAPDAPGFAVLVKQNGEVVFERGYGVRDLRA